MARGREEYCGPHNVQASDIHDYGAGYPVRDYLAGPLPEPVDWTITNPPFRLAELFANRALKTSRRGVAIFERTTFLEGIRRWEELFSITPPTLILQFSERVPIHKGRLVRNGSTATAYCWVIWERREYGLSAPFAQPTVFDWIPRCRKRLERDEDYQDAGGVP